MREVVLNFGEDPAISLTILQSVNISVFVRWKRNFFEIRFNEIFTSELKTKIY